MKKYISLILCAALICILLSGCSIKKSTDDPAAQQAGNFEPETTAVASGGMMQAIEEAENAAAPQPTYKIIDEAYAVDVPEETPVVEVTSTPAPEATPEPQTQAPGDPVYTTPTPQPNASVSSYAEISGTGLGVKFSYPSDWNNIPGRSTICYVQPMEEGTVYPARVAVSMKQVAHKVDAADLQQEMVLLFSVISSQYDASTFEVDTNVNTSARFMGNNAYSTTYLAYDGDQEIQGYVVMTAFEKYIFSFHFQCAYVDVAALTPAMQMMRDSVKLVQSELE